MPVLQFITDYFYIGQVTFCGYSYLQYTGRQLYDILKTGFIKFQWFFIMTLIIISGELIVSAHEMGVSNNQICNNISSIVSFY